jgi:phosphopentomutase
MTMPSSAGRRRAVLLVLDGLGAGEMPDRPAEDAGSFTLAHVCQLARLRLPALERLGLGNATRQAGPAGRTPLPPAARPEAAFGLAALGYPGADSVLGHQELMGSAAVAELRLLADLRDPLVRVLTAGGYDVQALQPGMSALIVNGRVLIADNIEAKAGLSINVTASLDDVPFGELLTIGQIVRREVPVPRVIVVGGRGFGIDQIRAHVKERSPGQAGVDTPALGVYDDQFQVRHLGADVETARQLPSLVAAAGGDVVLIGKAADVIGGDAAVRDPMVSTRQVLETTAARLGAMRGGLIVANIQETDLAGHEQDAHRFARVLAQVDASLPEILRRLRPGDVLVITGDHGNDPAIGHSQHTRELVPVLVAGPRVRPVDVGVRSSLADLGATLADLLGVPAPQSGTSFARMLSLCFSRPCWTRPGFRTAAYPGRGSRARVMI